MYYEARLLATSPYNTVLGFIAPGWAKFLLDLWGEVDIKHSNVAPLLAVGNVNDFSPHTKIHQAAVSAHRFCFSVVVGRCTNTLRIHTEKILSVQLTLSKAGTVHIGSSMSSMVFTSVACILTPP